LMYNSSRWAFDSALEHLYHRLNHIFDAWLGEIITIAAIGWSMCLRGQGSWCQIQMHESALILQDALK
jgi:hypothetical protein